MPLILNPTGFGSWPEAEDHQHKDRHAGPNPGAFYSLSGTWIQPATDPAGPRTSDLVGHEPPRGPMGTWRVGLGRKSRFLDLSSPTPLPLARPAFP